MSNRIRIILQVMGFLLLGILVARLFLDKEVTISNFYLKFDIIMHMIMIIGIFIMGFSKKKAGDTDL